MSSKPVIICENSIGMQKFCENGIPKNVHVVAKTLPFVMEVSFPLSLNRCKIEAALYYDGEDLKNLRLVPSPKDQAMEPKVFINETGNRATIECKINVLTSQHRAHFRVKVVASLLEDSTQSMELLSNPIMMVSKHSQATKQLQKKKAVPVTPVSSSEISPPKSAVYDGRDHSVFETLQRMEKRQIDQQKQLNHLLRNQGTEFIFESASVPDPNEMDFEEAFQRFVESYRRIPQEDRANKLRKIANTEGFGTFLEICATTISNQMESAIEVAEAPQIDGITDSLESSPNEWDCLYTEIFSSPDATPAQL